MLTLQASEAQVLVGAAAVLWGRLPALLAGHSLFRGTAPCRPARPWRPLPPALLLWRGLSVWGPAPVAARDVPHLTRGCPAPSFSERVDLSSHDGSRYVRVTCHALVAAHALLEGLGSRIPSAQSHPSRALSLSKLDPFCCHTPFLRAISCHLHRKSTVFAPR